jgi:antitoxin component of MazEF toxin-antitoxin module/DNA-binding Xre family transcriptional regulator
MSLWISYGYTGSCMTPTTRKQSGSVSTPESILDRDEMKRRRMALDLTQERAAELADFTTRQQWYEIEAGRQTNITLETLSRIAAALTCEPSDLLIATANGSRRKVVAASKRVKTVERTGRVSRWGNSLGVRIPQEAVERLGLRDGESVSLAIGSDSIAIRRDTPRKKWTEAELLKGVTPEMVGGEVDWGDPVGREAL